MTTVRLFVFSEDQDRFLKQMEEKALSTTWGAQSPSIPHGAKFYIQDARVTPALMVGKNCN